MSCRFWGYDFALEEDEDNNDLLQAPDGVTTLPLTRDIGVPPPVSPVTWHLVCSLHCNANITLGLVVPHLFSSLWLLFPSRRSVVPAGSVNRCANLKMDSGAGHV